MLRKCYFPPYSLLIFAFLSFKRSLGPEDPLEDSMATHSSTLAWRISMDRGACWAIVHGVAKSHT